MSNLSIILYAFCLTVVVMFVINVNKQYYSKENRAKREKYNSADFNSTVHKVCQECKGSGMDVMGSCNECHGRGFVDRL